MHVCIHGCLCNEKHIRGNNPWSVCFSWLLKQEAETPARVCVLVNLCVYQRERECECMFGEHWGGCCFHASHPDALSAHCSFSFASTVRVFASLCICVCNTTLQVPAASSSLVTECTSTQSTNTHSLSLWRNRTLLVPMQFWQPDSIIKTNKHYATD